MNILSKVPKWGTWVTSVGGAIVLLYSAYAWGADAVDKAVVTETELGVVLKSLETQRNQDKLMELSRDLIAERYANDAEKEFILKEIDRLQKELRCANEGICEVD